MLARAVTASLGGKFKRVQCTPDLLPNDVTGVSVYNQKTEAFEFHPGRFSSISCWWMKSTAHPAYPICPARSHAEQQVTVDGITYPLPRPFLVLATENPIEYEGTFPLPEAQLDRFLMRLSMGYPSQSDEKLLLTHLQHEHPITHLHSVEENASLVDLQRQVWDIHVDDSLHDYIVQLSAATRHHPELSLGASPRASLALFRAAQAYAAIKGRATSYRMISNTWLLQF